MARVHFREKDFKFYLKKKYYTAKTRIYGCVVLYFSLHPAAKLNDDLLVR